MNFPGTETIPAAPLTVAQYGNGRLCLIAGETKLTVNVPDAPLAEDEVIIKTYSKNHGVLGALINAKIVRHPSRWLPTGFVNLPVCKLLIDPNTLPPYHGIRMQLNRAAGGEGATEEGRAQEIARNHQASES